MADSKNIDINNLDEFEYTIVMHGDYINAPVKAADAPEQTAEAGGADSTSSAAGSQRTYTTRDEIDRLYYEYEKMCLKEPTILDKDDAYPHSYYWRIGGRYDQAKVAVLKEALKSGKKIADTEAYEKYTEGLSKLRFAPDSWD